MAQQATIDFKCPLCGGTHLKVDVDNDNSVASCASCGSEFGRWGDIKANLGFEGPTTKAAEKPTFKGMSSKFKM